MLDTSFHRPVGDIGNPQTFDFPVAYHVVKKATITRVVKLGDPTLIEPFIQGAKILQGRGVKAITTSCGFLAQFQYEIQSQLEVPFFASSLMQIPIAYMLTGGKVGIITARKSSLTKKHLEGVDAAHIPVVIEGMDDMPAFSSAIVEETKPLDMDAVTLDMKQVTSRLIENNPDIRGIVLECTNMPPYRNTIRKITQLPIYDINTLMNYVYKSVT